MRAFEDVVYPRTNINVITFDLGSIKKRKARKKFSMDIVENIIKEAPKKR